MIAKTFTPFLGVQPFTIMGFPVEAGQEVRLEVRVHRADGADLRVCPPDHYRPYLETRLFTTSLPVTQRRAAP